MTGGVTPGTDHAGGNCESKFRQHEPETIKLSFNIGPRGMDFAIA